MEKRWSICVCVCVFHRTALTALSHLTAELCVCPSPVFLPACCLEPFRDVSLPLSFLSLLLCEWSSTICLKYNIQHGSSSIAWKYPWSQKRFCKWLTPLGRLDTFIRIGRFGFGSFFCLVVILREHMSVFWCWPTCQLANFVMNKITVVLAHK